MMPPLLTTPAWTGHNGLVHAFLGRRGGHSLQPYHSLNLSYRVGDDPAAVKQNWHVVKAELLQGNGAVTIADQRHGEQITEVQRPAIKELGEADALITDRPGVWLGILTADCIPILMADPTRRVAAAVHAGWRGTVLGIAPKTVIRLAQTYGVRPASLLVCLGPAIGPCCYEVGRAVIEQLATRWGEEHLESWYRQPEEGKQRGQRGFIDLRQLNTMLLQRSGVPAGNISQLPICTACSVREFFSCRREGGETGRQLSLVGWSSNPSA